MVLINPNSSTATTRMMTAIARSTLAGRNLHVRGVTAPHGPAMLTDPTSLRAAVPHVLAAAHQALASGDCAALIVGAFGDPGVGELRRAWSLGPPAGPTAGAALSSPTGHDDPALPSGPAGPQPTAGSDGAGWANAPAIVAGAVRVPRIGLAVPQPTAGSDGAGWACAPAVVPGAVPVVGIGEAALAEAAAGGRRFGVATTTPHLEGSIAAHVERLGLAASYTGARFTSGAPARLAARPEALLAALAEAVRACVVRDGAEAVVIGGGPLGDAATALQARFTVPVIAPVPAACRLVATLLTRAAPEG
ncbi:aspartate/glutamate racemase family protein [Streptomyces roseoviridis]|uniref:Aspartate/glutamate racemase family protein n=1 Tax=Streptomyces roseoviridis TaxID=67361 RepID=A0ABV5QT77_9ACTN